MLLFSTGIYTLQFEKILHLYMLEVVLNKKLICFTQIWHVNICHIIFIISDQMVFFSLPFWPFSGKTKRRYESMLKVKT